MVRASNIWEFNSKINTCTGTLHMLSPTKQAADKNRGILIIYSQRSCSKTSRFALKRKDLVHVHFNFRLLCVWMRRFDIINHNIPGYNPNRCGLPRVMWQRYTHAPVILPQSNRTHRSSGFGYQCRTEHANVLLRVISGKILRHLLWTYLTKT